MEDGSLEGMQHFDQVIERMIRQGIITQEDGLAFATNQNNLLLRLSGLGSSSDFAGVGGSEISRMQKERQGLRHPTLGGFNPVTPPVRSTTETPRPSMLDIIER